MINAWKKIIWQQFGAAIDMLENAMLACPDQVWYDRSRQPEFWYMVYHTLFFLDFYLILFITSAENSRQSISRPKKILILLKISIEAAIRI